MDQLNMFDEVNVPSNKASYFAKEVTGVIKGLQYVEDYITEGDERLVSTFIDMQPWRQDLKRLVQHYGYIYDYKVRRADKSMRIGDLPEALQILAEILHRDKHMPYVADQVIVNQYLPGQGISKHIDCEPCFQDTIVSMSLGSSCVMEFRNNDIKLPIWLNPRSIIVLQDEARYLWTHAIPARKSDMNPHGESVKRNTRVSLTFRKVIL